MDRLLVDINLNLINRNSTKNGPWELLEHVEVNAKKKKKKRSRCRLRGEQWWDIGRPP